MGNPTSLLRLSLWPRHSSYPLFFFSTAARGAHGRRSAAGGAREADPRVGAAPPHPARRHVQAGAPPASHRSRPRSSSAPLPVAQPRRPLAPAGRGSRCSTPSASLTLPSSAPRRATWSAARARPPPRPCPARSVAGLRLGLALVGRRTTRPSSLLGLAPECMRCRHPDSSM